LRNVRASSVLALAAALHLSAASAAAQEVPAPEPAETPAEDSAGQAPIDTEIVVSAEAVRGSLDVPQPPVLELSEADIAAYGAGSLAELMQALAPQTGSSGGRGGGFPVMLVNGVRISSFREIRSYPPEAILKVEVFPEEVAQRYGYSPDQRVVNIVLKRNYSSRELELEYGQPWEGGYSQKEVEATYLQLMGNARLNFNLGWEDTSLLTEAERGVIQSNPPTFPSDPDPARYRSLISDAAGIEGTANFTTRLGEGGSSLSLNATFERADSLRYQGLDSVVLTAPGGASALRTFGEDDPLTVDARTDTFSLGATLNSSLGDWQITGTADGSLTDSRSLIERFADTTALADAAADGTLPIDAALPPVPDAGFDRADSRNTSASALVTAIGRPLLLPAGELSVTLDAGYSFTGIDSEDTRNPGVETSLERGDLSAGVNVSIPIASRREDHWAAIGDLSFNVQAGIDELSDFGTLTDVTLGLNWGVTERLNFGVSYIMRDAAPSLGQLGNPEIATPNVPVYDLSRNETVLATIISGGNPDLPASSQDDWRVSLNWELPPFWSAIQQGRFNIEYSDNSAVDVAAGFPALTPTIEAAFPDRVTRDANGQLVQIDQRPVSFAEQKSKRVGINLNFSGPFGKPRAQAQQNNPLAAAFGRQGGPGGQTPAGQGAPATGGAPAGGPGGFNPQVFQQLRTRFCTPEAVNTVPTSADLEGLPQPVRDRVMNADGTVDPARWAEFRGQMCNGNFAAGGDPARFAQLREQFCGRPGEEPPPITDEQLAALPPQMLERLKGPDGTVDPERVSQLRTQFCASPQQGQQGQQAAPGGQPGPGGPVVIIAPGAGPGGPGGFRGPGGQGGGGGGGFRGGGGGGGFIGGGGSPDGRGRFFVNLNYTYEIENEVLVAPGGPLLDQLDGQALSGSLPRHQLNFNGGLFYAGFGTNVNARYASSSFTEGSGLPGSTDLFFGDLFTVGFRVFADLNQRTALIEDVPLLKNTRVTLGVNNLFDSRQRIVDGSGSVPLRFQPYLVDPTGRFFEIELRKLF
jgi:iron complex outermembrane receptor protein